MNCLEFRRIVGAETDSATPQIVAHAALCPACTRYREELRQMDRLIHRALHIDTRIDSQADATIVPTAPQWRPVARQRRVPWGLAASVLAAVLTSLLLWVAAPRETLARQVVEHTQAEASAMVRTAEIVDPETVASILALSGVRMKPGAVAVSYAQSCAFRGHQVPHLVVQTDAGPVTVLLLAREKSIETPRTFDENGYQGMIVPAPRGVLAVLGHAVPVEEIATKLLAAVEYIG